MNVIVICGVYDDCCFDEIREKSAGAGQQAANRVQQRLIEGFRSNGDHVHVISAPFVPSWPKGYSDRLFSGFEADKMDGEIHYVHFNNTWGYRNISRSRSITRHLDSLSLDASADYLVLVYSAHTPFLIAANAFKRTHPNAKICLMVPDLPQYMNLSNEPSRTYRLFKRLDINQFNRACSEVDYFVLLTEQMRDLLSVGDKPYLVVEGICSEEIEASSFERHEIKNIVYTGKVDAAFGIRELLCAFSRIEDENVRLVVCGAGDAEDLLVEACSLDSRIEYKGLVAPEEATRITSDAAVLVNPRMALEEYTRYSFPSKTIEYLLTGCPVVCSILPGMPDAYKDFVFEVCGNDAESLYLALISALTASREEIECKSRAAVQYLRESLRPSVVANSISGLVRNDSLFVESEN